jgi:hypothetical protein
MSTGYITDTTRNSTAPDTPPLSTTANEPGQRGGMTATPSSSLKSKSYSQDVERRQNLKFNSNNGEDCESHMQLPLKSQISRGKTRLYKVSTRCPIRRSRLPSATFLASTLPRGATNNLSLSDVENNTLLGSREAGTVCLREQTVPDSPCFDIFIPGEYSRDAVFRGYRNLVTY